MTDAAARTQRSEAIVEESETLLEQLIAAADRLDEWVTELRLEADRRSKGAT